MPTYEITPDEIVPLAKTTFAAAGLSERSDLQRLLRDRIEILSPDTLVIAEEFSDWDESKRRRPPRSRPRRQAGRDRAQAHGRRRAHGVPLLYFEGDPDGRPCFPIGALAEPRPGKDSRRHSAV